MSKFPKLPEAAAKLLSRYAMDVSPLPSPPEISHWTRWSVRSQTFSGGNWIQSEFAYERPADALQKAKDCIDDMLGCLYGHADMRVEYVSTASTGDPVCDACAMPTPDWRGRSSDGLCWQCWAANEAAAR